MQINLILTKTVKYANPESHSEKCIHTTKDVVINVYFCCPMFTIHPEMMFMYRITVKKKRTGKHTSAGSSFIYIIPQDNSSLLTHAQPNQAHLPLPPQPYDNDIPK